MARPSILKAANPGQKLGVAVIGADGMGGYSTDEALRENLVAIADVDDNKIAQVMKSKVKDRPKPKIFNDYRKMLEECSRDIDVVLIATPDHNHAPAAIRAIDLGKHVFCQKPLAHNIQLWSFEGHLVLDGRGDCGAPQGRGAFLAAA